jgi:dolichyl-phosphate beta-glucosyltransferase
VSAAPAPMSAATVFPASVCIVVPCYNEAARLDGDAFVRCAQENEWLRLLFVDDGSKDATASVIAGLAARCPQRIRGMTLAKNGGKAEAVRQGFLAAFAETSPAEYVGFWDADLATPLADVRTFADILQKNDRLLAVFGSRVSLLGRNIVRSPLRHYVGRVFATAASTILRLPIYDTQCGAKLFRSTPEVRAVFGERFLSAWVFDVEIIARLGDELGANGGPHRRDVIYEHPLLAWRDVAGSKVRLRHFFTAAVDLVRIAFRPRRPGR